mmetsp:Transcript_54757/g.159728  ORF Transcript_54757/g.159728 Transcript_54757/m.159728 type:complete len:266 (+) Transcript_54757:93-890(+)
MLSADAGVFVPNGSKLNGDWDKNGALHDDMKSTAVSDSTSRESPLCGEDAGSMFGEPDMQHYVSVLPGANNLWQWEPVTTDPDDGALPPPFIQEQLGPQCLEGSLFAFSGGLDITADFPVAGNLPNVQEWKYPGPCIDELWNKEVLLNEPEPHWPEGTDDNCDGVMINPSCMQAAQSQRQTGSGRPVPKPPYASTEAIAREVAPRPSDAGSDPLAICLGGKLDGNAWLEPAVGRVDVASDSHKVQLEQMTVEELYQSFLLKGAGR